MTQTLTQFRETRRYGDLTEIMATQGIEEEGHGYVYADGLFIHDIGHSAGRWELILGNQDWLSDDLAALEARLYDFACSEGYVDNPDAPVESD